jgi:nucleoside-diphosphate-sugar epimerase
MAGRSVPSVIADANESYSRFIGVDAVIHIASPGPRKGADKAQIIARAIEGAVGLMKSTISAGIKKFVYTSSIVALMDRKLPTRRMV